MKVIIYFFMLFMALTVKAADATDFSLVPEGSKEEKTDNPIGQVDEKGEIQWKYPEGYFEKKQQAMENALKIKKQQEVEAEKRRLQDILNKKMERLNQERSLASEEDKTPKFVPASNSGRQVKALAHILGYYYGSNVSVLWRKGHWSYGVMGKYSMASNPDTNTKENLFGVLGQGQYHFYPRWYTDSTFHKVLDPYAVVSGGYLSSDKDSAGLGITTGLGASYPLQKGFKVYGEYEMMFFKSLDKLHGSYSVGISWEF